MSRTRRPARTSARRRPVRLALQRLERRGAPLPNLTVASGATLSVTGGDSQVNIVDCEIAGTLNAAAGGTLRFLNGDNNHLNAGISLTGPGTFLIEGGTFGAPVVTLNAP